MPLMIDCYNVLHESMPPSLAGLDEAGLCRALVRSGMAQQRVVVVCDGRPKPDTPAHVPEGVTLLHAGGGRSADDVIIHRIDRESAAKRWVVVTSDREIIKAVRRRGAKVMPSATFVRHLAAMLGRQRSAQDSNRGEDEGQASIRTRRFVPVRGDAVAYWARLMGVDPNQKVD